MNATLAQFEFEYLVLADTFDAALANGTLTASDAAAGARAQREAQEADMNGGGAEEGGGRLVDEEERLSWVPCSPDRLAVTAAGCHQVRSALRAGRGRAQAAQLRAGGSLHSAAPAGRLVLPPGQRAAPAWRPARLATRESARLLCSAAPVPPQAAPGGGERYWLRVNVSCSHEEHPDHPPHVDSAAFEAAVLLDGDGELQVGRRAARGRLVLAAARAVGCRAGQAAAPALQTTSGAACMGPPCPPCLPRPPHRPAHPIPPTRSNPPTCLSRSTSAPCCWTSTARTPTSWPAWTPCAWCAAPAASRCRERPACRRRAWRCGRWSRASGRCGAVRGGAGAQLLLPGERASGWHPGRRWLRSGRRPRLRGPPASTPSSRTAPRHRQTPPPPQCVTGFAIAPSGVCEPAGTEGTERPPPGARRRHRPGMIGSTADFRDAIKPFVPSWPANKPNATEADLEEVAPGPGTSPESGGGSPEGGGSGGGEKPPEEPPLPPGLEAGKAGPAGPDNVTAAEQPEVCGDPGPDPEPLPGDPGLGEDVAGLYPTVSLAGRPAPVLLCWLEGRAASGHGCPGRHRPSAHPATLPPLCPRPAASRPASAGGRLSTPPIRATSAARAGE